MKVICLGEMLIDFVCTEKGCNLIQGEHFTKLPGGAPANVAACIARLGGQSEFVGAVGKDAFGQFLLHTLKEYGVGVGQAVQVCEPTTLAFVSRKQDGDRDFQFFRGADACLNIGSAQIEALLGDALLHLGSATALLGGDLFDSYMRMAKAAKENHCLVSFDPNYRHDLYQGEAAFAAFHDKCQQLFTLADIVKVSDEEIGLLSHGETLQQQCQALHQSGVKVVLVTLGPQGCIVSVNDQQIIVPAYKIDVLDTTGAGDAFIGAVLFQLASLEAGQDYRSVMPDIVAFAQKVSALVCTRLGAMTALPTLAQVNSVQLTALQYD